MYLKNILPRPLSRHWNLDKIKLMSIFEKNKPVKTTEFSEFIRNAPSKDKKRVYSGVLDKASEEQNSVIDKAKNLKK